MLFKIILELSHKILSILPWKLPPPLSGWRKFTKWRSSRPTIFSYDLETLFQLYRRYYVSRFFAFVMDNWVLSLYFFPPFSSHCSTRDRYHFDDNTPFSIFLHIYIFLFFFFVIFEILYLYIQRNSPFFFTSNYVIRYIEIFIILIPIVPR